MQFTGGNKAICKAVSIYKSLGHWTVSVGLWQDPGVFLKLMHTRMGKSAPDCFRFGESRHLIPSLYTNYWLSLPAAIGEPGFRRTSSSPLFVRG